MTAYSIESTTSGYLAMFPVSFETRVAQIQFTGEYYDSVSGTQGGFVGGVWYKSGFTATGSAYTPTPLREGAVAATATAKLGLSGFSVPTIQLASYQGVGGSASFTYQPPFDTIIQPGSALVVEWSFPAGGSGITSQGSVNVFFEELRLSWPS